VENLLSGSVAPDDAPPGYGPVAALFEAVKGQRRWRAEIDPAFQKRMVVAVLSARQPGAVGLWRRSRRKAAVGVIFVMAATSSLAAADVIPMPFGGVIDLRRGGAGDSPTNPPPRTDRWDQSGDSRLLVPSVPADLPAPAAPPNTLGSPETGAPPQPVAGTQATPPPQSPAAPAHHVPPGQARKSPGAVPGQGLPPGHPNGNNGGGNGNGNASGNNGAPATTQAPAGDSPRQGNAYGRDGQPGPPGQVPPGRSNRSGP
jgi:hypothetical protein